MSPRTTMGRARLLWLSMVAASTATASLLVIGCNAAKRAEHNAGSLLVARAADSPQSPATIRP